MVKEKKEFQRSVRLTKTVQEYVEAQKGEGFNEKFENMVLFCMQEEAAIQKRIDERKAQLRKLDNNISKVQGFLSAIDRMRWNVESAINSAEAITKSIQT